MHKFLESLEPIAKNIGPLMFQFEYLNKQKIPGGLQQFIDQFGQFVEQLPAGKKYFLESRNPNYLSSKYFDFLNSQGLHHVFLYGYYMPPILKFTKNTGSRYKKPLLFDSTTQIGKG
jgi:uncharacterized protein YecE (DUF72 family)